MHLKGLVFGAIKEYQYLDWPQTLHIQPTEYSPYKLSFMADSSFDIVSKVDPQEIANALNQASKEVEQRYDFKGVGASIEESGEKILIKANSEERAKAVLDVFQSKLVKRGISLKSLEDGKPFASGKEFRIECKIKEGISQENAKKINKILRDEGPKSVKSQIQGDELRVSSKSRDDLQEVQALLKSKDLEVDVQFVNYR
jgi:cyclic-di-GMP-binding protein